MDPEVKHLCLDSKRCTRLTQPSPLVCAIERVTNTIEEVTLIDATIPIAGEFSHSKGGALDPKWTRLKTSSDEKREGLRLEMHGGNFAKQKQQATVEFICRKEAGDKLRRGEKNLDASDDNEDPGDEDEDDSKEGQEVDDEHGGTLRYKSWSIEGGVNVLRLDWHTKYACEDASSASDGPSSGHWGFFTWFIIMYVKSSEMILPLDLLSFSVSSLALQPISYSDLGSTIIDTPLEDGI